MEEFFGGRDDGRGEVGFYECGVVRLGGVREELDAPDFGVRAGGGGPRGELFWEGSDVRPVSGAGVGGGFEGGGAEGGELGRG